MRRASRTWRSILRQVYRFLMKHWVRRGQLIERVMSMTGCCYYHARQFVDTAINSNVFEPMARGVWGIRYRLRSGAVAPSR